MKPKDSPWLAISLVAAPIVLTILALYLAFAR